MTQETPREALLAALRCWQGRDYAALALRVRPAQREPTRREVQEVRLAYRQEILRGFRILDTRDTDPAAASVDTELLLTQGGEWLLVRRRYRMVYLDGSGRPVDRTRPEGRWIPHTTYALPGPTPLLA
ncbi:hypothetical protein Dcar01_00753 [Deinococcus carri]|uniref:NTF2 fold immunity protein domain-containing protein n=1 Tax=Deinococcus carri TaxID=1211323 RepID=A0ABP9W3X0_9DEIO